MSSPLFHVPDEGVKQFLEQYVIPGRRKESMTHGGICVITNSIWDHFDLLTEEPFDPPNMSSYLSPGRPVRSFPGPDYLGQYTLVTHNLKLDEDNYNNGAPQDPRLAAGFRRLADLFHVDIPVR